MDTESCDAACPHSAEPPKAHCFLDSSTDSRPLGPGVSSSRFGSHSGGFCSAAAARRVSTAPLLVPPVPQMARSPPSMAGGYLAGPPDVDPNSQFLFLFFFTLLNNT